MNDFLAYPCYILSESRRGETRTRCKEIYFEVGNSEWVLSRK